MKQKGFGGYGIFLVILSSLLLLFIFATSFQQNLSGRAISDISEKIDNTKQTIDNLPKTPEDAALKIKNSSMPYLQEQWLKFAENNVYLSPFVNYVNPVTSILLKVNIFPPNWEFWIALFLFITAGLYLWAVLDMFSTFSETTSGIIGFLISLVIGIIGIWAQLAVALVSAIYLLTSWWMKLIMVLLIIISLSICAAFSKNIRDYAKLSKAKKREEEQSENQDRLKREVNKIESVNKEISKALED